MWYRYNAASFLKIPHERHPIPCPLGKLIIVNYNSGLFSVPVSTVMYVILCYFGQCYNGTWLYWLLTHWGFGNLIIIGSDNDLLPGRRQTIIWTNAWILLIGTLGTNFSEMLIEILAFSLKKCVWKCRLWNGGHFASASMCYGHITRLVMKLEFYRLDNTVAADA